MEAEPCIVRLVWKEASAYSLASVNQERRVVTPSTTTKGPSEKSQAIPEYRGVAMEKRLLVGTPPAGSLLEGQ